MCSGNFSFIFYAFEQLNTRKVTPNRETERQYFVFSTTEVTEKKHKLFTTSNASNSSFKFHLIRLF